MDSNDDGTHSEGEFASEQPVVDEAGALGDGGATTSAVVDEQDGATSGVRSEAAERRAAQQEIVIELLSRGASYGDAGERAQVDRRTIARWMGDPGFRQQVNERRQAWVVEVTGQLVVAGPDAVAVLRDECRGGERSADRVRAAATLLTTGQRFVREYEFHERLRAVEERLGLAEPSAAMPLDGDDAAPGAL